MFVMYTLDGVEARRGEREQEQPEERHEKRTDPEEASMLTQ